MLRYQTSRLPQDHSGQTLGYKQPVENIRAEPDNRQPGKYMTKMAAMERFLLLPQELLRS